MAAGSNRLPAPAGLLIDRDRTVSFSFENRHFEGLAGDCIASALAALTVAWLTIALQAGRAATARPVLALRYE